MPRHGYERDGPDLGDWLERTLYQPRASSDRSERDCGFPPSCPRWTDGPNTPLCRAHLERWKSRGRPDLTQWFAELAHGTDPRVRLGQLEPRLRLEVQFGLQCRNEEATRLAPIRCLVQAVSALVKAAEHGVTSLLDWDDEQWDA